MISDPDDMHPKSWNSTFPCPENTEVFCLTKEVNSLESQLSHAFKELNMHYEAVKKHMYIGNYRARRGLLSRFPLFGVH